MATEFKLYHLDIYAEWTKSSPDHRRKHVEVLLESLEHRDAVIRFTNARRLFYILQGQSSNFLKTSV
jgi:hypothetical protein